MSTIEIHYGGDVASFQHPAGASINWHAAYAYFLKKGNGAIPFIVIKITESDNYFNNYAISDIQGALAAGFKVAIYHFVHGNISAYDQVAWIRQHLEGVHFLFLDCETENGSTAPAYIALINAIIDSLKTLGEDMGLYTYTGFFGWLTSGGYADTNPLWLADPSKVDPGQPRAITQIGQGTVPGIQGQVDLDTADANGFQLIFGSDPISIKPVIQPQEKDMTPILHYVPVSLDANGSGAVILDGGANSLPGIASSTVSVPWSNYIAIASQGSDPAPNADNKYWSWDARIQQRNGFLLVTVTNGPPNQQAGVYVTASA